MFDPNIHTVALESDPSMHGIGTKSKLKPKRNHQGILPERRNRTISTRLTAPRVIPTRIRPQGSVRIHQASRSLSAAAQKQGGSEWPGPGGGGGPHLLAGLPTQRAIAATSMPVRQLNHHPVLSTLQGLSLLYCRYTWFFEVFLFYATAIWHRYVSQGYDMLRLYANFICSITLNNNIYWSVWIVHTQCQAS